MRGSSFLSDCVYSCAVCGSSFLSAGNFPNFRMEHQAENQELSESKRKMWM